MPLPKDTLQKQYQIRMPVEGRKSFIVTMPYEVVVREARRRGLKLEEFLEKYQVIAHYDNFEGVFYTFEAVKDKDEADKISQGT